MFQKKIFSSICIFLCIFAGTVALFLFDRLQIQALDSFVAQWLYAHRTDSLVTIFSAITLLGESLFLAPVSFFIAVGMYFYRPLRSFVVPFIVSVGGTAVSVAMLKLFFQRPRPGGLLPTYIEHSFSFPSGHAAIAIAFYGFLFFMGMCLSRTKRMRMWCVIFGLMLILAIGFSRLYLDVHFLSDVWGGYVVGGGWLLLSIFCYQNKCLQK